jgi:predicted lysophospholipase L1 biosynthesis ABC-type transport system permease subunit
MNQEKWIQSLISEQAVQANRVNRVTIDERAIKIELSSAIAQEAVGEFGNHLFAQPHHDLWQRFDLCQGRAGVLGLLVGGLGISNTLQVILARRKLEIAVLKTLGYR